MKERLNQRLLQPFEHDTVGQWCLCRENRINGKYLKRNIKYFLSQETKLCLLFKIAPKSFDMNWNLSNHIQQDIHITGVGFCKGLVTVERNICCIWFEAQFTIDQVYTVLAETVNDCFDLTFTEICWQLHLTFSRWAWDRGGQVLGPRRAGTRG